MSRMAGALASSRSECVEPHKLWPEFVEFAPQHASFHVDVCLTLGSELVTGDYFATQDQAVFGA